MLLILVLRDKSETDPTWQAQVAERQRRDVLACTGDTKGVVLPADDSPFLSESTLKDENLLLFLRSLRELNPAAFSLRPQANCMRPLLPGSS